MAGIAIGTLVRAFPIVVGMAVITMRVGLMKHLGFLKVVALTGNGGHEDRCSEEVGKFHRGVSSLPDSPDKGE